MMKYIFSSFLVCVLVAAVYCSCPGCPSEISEKDIESEDVQTLVKSGVDKIYKEKVAANSLPSCVELEGTVKSGTEQVVAGTKYVLDIEVKPIQSKTDECAAANVDLSAVETEHCQIDIWVKLNHNLPEDERTEITYKCE